MKNRNLILALFFILLAAIGISTGFFLAKGKSTAPTEAEADPRQINAVSKKLDTLNITVDPRIELLTAVQQQSDYKVLTNFDFTYKAAMEEYFQGYRKHDAIKSFNKLKNLGFNYDAPPETMLFLSNPPNLTENLEITEDLILRATDKNKLSEFIEALRDFSKDSDFQKFYFQNIPFYQTMIDKVYQDTKDMKLIEELNSYYAMDANSYTLILSPMLHNGGYGPGITTKDGLDIYGIIGPDSVMEEKSGTLLPTYSIEGIRHIVWHEFSHSFVNPLTKKYLDEVNKCDKLYSYIERRMNKQAYVNWETCVNEHIIRAVTARLTYLNLGKGAGDSMIANERANAFYYVPALCDSLEFYEGHRDTYPTFESYYPELIKVFKKLSDQELPDEFFLNDFTGPINSAFNYFAFWQIKHTREVI